ncbi:putative Glycosyltransferase [Gammaproteobacteria bacterium]
MRAIILLLFIFPIMISAAPIYKWIDSAGLTHYTQDPPKHGNAQVIVPKVSPGVSPEQAEEIVDKLRKDSAMDNEARAKAQEEQLKIQAKREESDARARRCAEARTRLESLHNSPRVAVKDAQGEYRRIDDDERNSLIKQTEATIEKECRQ